MLKGKVSIQLRDAKTGRITDEVHGENTLTGALDSMINDSDFGLGNMAFNNAAVSGAGITNNSPLYAVALGGIQLFNSFSNPMDVNDLYEPLSNPPVAYASKENLGTLGDSKLGTYNSVESSVSQDKKTVTMVYDWSSSQGNGQIGAVALSHLKNSKWFNDSDHFLSISGGIGYSRALAFSDNEAIIGMGNGGIFTRGTNEDSPNLVKFYRLGEDYINLVMNWGPESVAIEPTWSKTFDLNPVPSVCYDPTTNKLFLISCSGGTTAEMIIVDPADNFSETTRTITIGTGMISTSFNSYSWGRNKHDVFAVCGSKLYTINSDLTALLIINLQNLADVVSVAFGTTLATSNKAWAVQTDGKMIYVIVTNLSDTCYLFDLDGTKHEIPGYTGGRPLLRKGVWLYGSPMAGHSGGAYLGKTILTPYNATKFVLSSVVTKDASKTMKVSYTITEVQPNH